LDFRTSYKLYRVIATIAVTILLCHQQSYAEGFWKRASNPYYQTFGLKGTDMFTWGFEWGSTLSFYDASSYTFMAEEGFAVEGGDKIIDTHVNGFALVSLGYYASNDVHFSINTGWQGLQKSKRIIPLTGRITYLFAGVPDLGSSTEESSVHMPSVQHFLFFDTGVGFSQSQLHGMSLLAKAGYGIRLPLGYGLSLDTMLSFQGAYAHPEIYDNFADRKVPWEMVGRSDSFYMGVSLSMAIRF